jgi:hypothetical protein
MQSDKRWSLSRAAIVAAMIAVGPAATADEVPMTKEMKSMVDFQCHGAKTLKQAEDNLARMERDYTEQHPVVACLKRKVAEMKQGTK